MDFNFSGLTQEEAKRRLNIYGKNIIEKRKKKSAWKIFLSQFTSPIILLLIFASILSFLVNYYKHEGFFEPVLILVIVFFSGIAGFIQDYKAEKTVEALQKMATPKAKVIRSGKEMLISSEEVVPGDIIVVEGGDIIPADAQIIEGSVEVDESFLTGESRNVKKKKGDKIYLGSSVYVGKAIAKVLTTGMKTEMGKIAEKMQEIEQEKTPFQEHMEKFTKKIVYFTGAIIVFTLFISIEKFGLIEAGLIAVSLAVAAIPEDLPAVITISLSLGARDMAKKNALVRRLAITESIGSVDVICTDKTGTITEGKMKVEKLWLLKNSKKSKEISYKIAYYCNDAKKVKTDHTTKWVGDETDIALKEFVSKYIKKEEGKRIYSVPFSSETKYMGVVHSFGKENITFVKGAPEVVLKFSTKYLDEKEKKLTKETREKIMKKVNDFSSKGFRVIALAYKKYDPKDKKLNKNLVFVGLAVLRDPPRPEVKQAIKECHQAGIRVIMITGDNPLTAKAIAEEVGIKTEGVITGEELEKMSIEKLKYELSRGVNIFARVNPFHKLTILRALQEEGHVVAMTGDGVNDALAIKKADVGISMGVKGTEVAKEASDIILLDDNFATIRTAIKEGRRIFDNIRKFVDYLLTCNVAEVFVVTSTILFLPFISLYPIQILWINLITDGLPALALSVDPPRPDVMKRKPRKRNEGIINKKLAMLISFIGWKKAAVILSTFLLVLPLGEEKARTTLFTAFILYEFVRIAVIRYNEKFKSLKDWFGNKFLNYSLLTSFLLQLLIVYSPIGKFFNTVPLGLYEWSILMIGTIVGFVLGILIAKIVDKITKEEY